MSRPLDNRVALITGAGTGIGRATAERLAADGAFIGIHYHSSRTGADRTLAAIRRMGGDGLLIPGDISREAEANGMVDALVRERGRLDILVNNAGTPVQRVSIEDCPLEVWEQVIATNLTGSFLVTRRAIPHLRASGHGSIINNLSLSVQTGGAHGGGPYAASKGGLQVFTRTLARELAPQVRVNAVMPGVIETPHHDVFSTPERMEQYRRETPIGRNGNPGEVAQVIAFLAGDESSFMTGALLDINGGRFLR
ncbi:MAG: short-chain dehydrogenase [Lentisphaerae bacterium RIFOXYC12_FULL_60_16]|nr:MAG: short-chain dehydrogenase [Lentisphaerae bacterium RIFOXYC12_FULL_60_16]